MRKPVLLVPCALALASVPAFAVTLPDVTLTPTFQSSPIGAQTWNLTTSAVLISYRLDLSGVNYTPTYVEVGVTNSPSATPFNPSTGIWMASTVDNLVSNNTTLNENDKHNLQNVGGGNETLYNVKPDGSVVAPFGTTDNYGIWFDRDGVDASQATAWGAAGTYNTNGVYNIQLLLRATSANTGVAFATVNGVQQGFGLNPNAAPNIYPAGLSFTGDMTNMKIFAGLWSPSGTGSATITNFSANAVPEPSTVMLALSGFGALVLLRRRAR